MSENCQVCFESEITSAIVPCGHYVACNSCLSEMASCPTCRGEKRDVMPIYMATSPTQSQATAEVALPSALFDWLMSLFYQKNVSESCRNKPLPSVPVKAPLSPDGSDSDGGASGSDSDGSGSASDSGDFLSAGSKPPVPPKTAAVRALLAAKPEVLTTLPVCDDCGCMALTLKGVRCPRKNNGFSEYCWQHDPEPRCQALTNKHERCSRKLASGSKSHFCAQHQKQSAYRRSLNKTAL